MPHPRFILRTFPFTCIGLASLVLFLLAGPLFRAEPQESVLGTMAMELLRILMAPGYLAALLILPLAERISGALGVGGAWLWWIGLPLRLLPFAMVDGAIALVRWRTQRLFPVFRRSR